MSAALLLLVPLACPRAAAAPAPDADGLTGPLIEVAIGATTDREPAVAYDPTSGLYLVAWERYVSDIDREVHVAAISSDGVVLNELGLGGPSAGRPVVAAVAGSGRMVVISEAEPLVGLSWLRATSMQLAPGVGVDTQSLFHTDLTDSLLGGIEAGIGGGSGSEALLAWTQGGQELFVQRLSVPTTAAPSLVGSPTSVASGLPIEGPMVARAVGPVGTSPVWMVSFSSFNASYGHWAMGVRGYDALGNQVHSMGLGNSPHELRNAVIAPNSDSAWTVLNVIEYSWGEVDLLPFRLEDVGGSLQLTPGLNFGGNGTDDVDPSLVWLGGRVGVLWSKRDGAGDADLFTMSLGDDGLPECGAETLLLADASEALDGVRVAAAWPDGNGEVAHALAVWRESELAAPFDEDVVARLLEPVGNGSLEDMGGGCGGGGTLTVSGVVSGNPHARFELSGAEAGATLALLNVNFSADAVVGCGPCAGLLPGLLFPVPAVAGSASTTLPIPCASNLVGALIGVQWIVLPTAGTPCPLFPNLAVSNRVRASIGS